MSCIKKYRAPSNVGESDSVCFAGSTKAASFRTDFNTDVCSEEKGGGIGREPDSLAGEKSGSPVLFVGL